MPPPNTPEEGLVSRPGSRSGQPTHTVDLGALEYEGEVDENLICPICHLPLLSPVITKCDHVFCRRCIVQAHSLNPVCPVDRQPLGSLDLETRPAPKIVENQLGSLLVRCPNKSRGCGMVIARSLVENHVDRYCDKTLVRCPHPKCCKAVARKDAGIGCLHYDVECQYCGDVCEKVDLQDHQDNHCPNRQATCALCDAEYVRHKQQEHMKQCPEAQIACKFVLPGCTHLMRRKRLEEHCQSCAYRVVGPVWEHLAELRGELRVLQERDQLIERRIKFLENKGYSSSSTGAAADVSSIPHPTTTTGTTAVADSSAAPYDSRDQYFLSLFEVMEAKMERLSLALTEVEGRHSVMMFNETLSLKDQLSEIRSTLGVLGMHVRWLMNFRLQERGRTAAPPSPSNSNSTTTPNTTTATGNSAHQDGSGGGGGGGESIFGFPRRLSDTLRENPPRL
ncbi:hypothetical protein F5Y17DRAFT_109449 [Xylariaceae sp. FL0594]|nr:hypothetical protein F5Y17DRAFT_109449 [Xylariaceae sp. FL0594]